MAAPMVDILSKLETDFKTLTATPEDYLTLQKGTALKLRKSLKCLYDSYKKNVPAGKTPALEELIVKDFDEEQVWQQLELQNDGIVNKLVSDVAHLVTSKKRPLFSSSEVAGQARKTGHNKGKKVIEDEDYEEEDDTVEEDNELELGEDENEDGDLSDNSLDQLEDDDNETIDKDDKFFDFTGDSDDDLNFDFGPLGQKSDLNDDLFDNGDSSGAEKEAGGKGKAKGQKLKKSVTFKDDVEQAHKGNKVKDNNYKGRLRSGQKEGSLDKELSELEAFLDEEDKKEEKRIKREQEGIVDNESDDDEQEYINMFDNMDSGEEDLFYDDFFDQPDDGDDDEEDEDEESSNEEDEEEEEDDDEEEEDEEDYADQEEENESLTSKKPGKAKRDLLAESDSEGEDVSEVLGGKPGQKSTFELRQEKLKKKISEMEDNLVSDKPWQLSGEIAGGKRPENSLLQENLQFEYTTRLAPEITEETTKTLEDIIKQRIKDKVFDDVERKIKPKDNPFEYKKRVTLDQEKSKISLGEIYEQEYLKQQQTEEEEKSDPDHESIKKMMQALFVQLDALSNFHYTPKQAVAEVKIVSNQPTINMEEVAPVAIADSALLAPEEIQDKLKTEVKGLTEKTKTDKERERRNKKARKREKQKEKEKRQKLVEKLNPGLGNKYSKESAMKKLEKDSKGNNTGLTLIKDGEKDRGNRTSSKTFFTQLQEEVTTRINSNKAEKRKKTDTMRPSVKKFKL